MDRNPLRLGSTPVWLALAGGLALLAAPADAQSRRMMMVEDTGGGPTILHMSSPDLRTLREPDFVRSDLPIFRDRLRLDDVQYAGVESALTTYLESFQALIETSLPKPQRLVGGPGALGDVSFGFGDADHDHPHVGHGDVPFGDFAGLVTEDGQAIEFAGDGPTAVAITIEATGGPMGWVGGGGGGVTEDVDVEVGVGGDGEPMAGVFIAVDTPGGVEMTDEMREKLEAKAEEIAARLKQQMEDGEIDGQGPLGMAAPIDFEDARERMLELDSIARETAAAKALLEQEFLGTVQQGLRDEQLGYWPELERTLTRHKTLPKGRLDGERTDLLEVLETVDVDLDHADPALAETVYAYELALDDALKRRNAYLEDAEPRISEALQSMDTDTALDVVDRATQLRVAVRDVNERFMSHIGQQLDDSTAAQFDARAREVSYPSVYGRSHGLRVFEAARQLEGLPESTLMQILELEGAFRPELDRASANLLDAIRRHQPAEAREGIEHMHRALGPEGTTVGGDSPIRAAKRERRELERRYVDRLHALLAPEQVEQLPALPKIRRGPFIFESSGAQ